LSARGDDRRLCRQRSGRRLVWKDAYEASEAAAVLFLRKYAQGMQKKARGPLRYLAMLERLSALLPWHTRRSEESERLQQFSTPLGLGYLMTLAVQLRPGQSVLEPSAGTGLLAIHAELSGATLMLNELAETRRAMLAALFADAPVTGFNAEQIDDYLGPTHRPAAVLMNPPFSASPYIDRVSRDAAARHIRSALRQLPDGGRLVALTGANHDPSDDLGPDATVVFTAIMMARSMRGTAPPWTQGSPSSTVLRRPAARR
jgi:predicted RNA methylase